MTVERQKALELHRRARGKIKMYPTVNIRNEEDLAETYVQGSAYAAAEIQEDRDRSYEYTGRNNRLAVITDGTSVLGMGNIGPHAAL
ncbi:MAG: NAD-dependent malic enzyme, partial [Aminobacterium colombiense]|nr:NAD-dependent malic enzyme [Aminobacterium colombiense]